MSVQAFAQDTIQLWPNGAPNDNGEDNVAEITIHAPNPTTNTGKAVIICPGGGYKKLAMDHEGHWIATWLAENGITGVVLKYRLPAGNNEIPASDANEAIRYIRANAARLGIDPHQIGIMGSSAGGHLAATVSTLPTDSMSRPDFSVLFYPVISSTPSIAHKGSFKNLLGDKSTDKTLLLKYSPEKQVTPQTPPAILLLSDDDKGVNPLNSISYYKSLKSNGIPASMHIFPEGGHGWGFNPEFPHLNTVKLLILDWISRQ